MLTIRSEQIQTLSEYMLRQFEDRTVVHLQSRLPQQAEKMGEPALRELIHAGVERAKPYGVVKQYDVRRFLECMMLYGPEFDTTPATEWAQAILCQPTLTGTEKMDRIALRAAFVQRGG